MTALIETARLGRRTVVMGILNVTPDSFSDGGRYLRRDAALQRALDMAAAGAGIIDVGGESTRPGAATVDPDEEIARVIPVIEALSQEPGLVTCVDTRKASVARLALEAGAAMVNDVSAMTADPEMAGVVAQYGAAVCLMHMRGSPETMQQDPRYSDVVREVAGYLQERAGAAESAK
ncbi:MAG: dihydropteroate synthase, partial [Armatimonadetes bacterium]|nr:dihydropteroate synthase [Armatimonadota bacterium]